MRKYIGLGLLAFLPACGQSPSQQAANLSNVVTIAANAATCYAVVRASTTQSNSLSNVLNGANVIANFDACTAVDTATAELIASAINTNSTVVTAPVSAPAPVTVPAPAAATATGK